MLDRILALPGPVLAAIGLVALLVGGGTLHLVNFVGGQTGNSRTLRRTLVALTIVIITISLWAMRDFLPSFQR